MLRERDPDPLGRHARAVAVEALSRQEHALIVALGPVLLDQVSQQGGVNNCLCSHVGHHVVGG